MRPRATLLALALFSFLATAQDFEQTVAALSVNGKQVSTAEIIDIVGDDVYLPAKRWRELLVTVSEKHGPDEKLSARSLGLAVVFDDSAQLYKITVPSRLLPMQDFSKIAARNTDVSPAPKGVMVGYDIAVKQSRSGLSASVAHDLRTHVLGGVLSTTGQYNPTSDDTYKRGLTTWSKDLYGKGVSVQVGDVFTTGHNNLLGGTVNLGGIRVGSDRSLSSDAMYPVPLLGGIADTRSTAEVLVDGQRRRKADVVAGPYQFASTFGSAGLSTTSLVVRDEFGREQVQTRDYYAMPSMTRDGKWEWDVALGKVRQGTTDTYTQNALTANAKYGVNDNWTVRGSVQTTGENTNLSVGSVVSMGRAGGLSATVAKSDDGYAYALGYERRTKNTSLSLSHTYLSEDYWQLSEERGSAFKPKSFTTASFATHGEKWRGDIAYTDTKLWNGEQRQEVSGRVMWNATPSDDVSVYVTHDLKTRDTTGGIGWQHRFGGNTTGSLAYSFGENSQRLASLQGYNKIKGVPVRWGVATDGEKHYIGADAEFSKGKVGAKLRNDSVELSAQGGLWIGEGGVIPTKRSYGSFVVAEVPNTSGALVRGPAQSGTTNKNGYVVFPNGPALRDTLVSVDTTTLPLDTQLETGSQKAVAPRRGGAKIVFPVQSDTMREFVIYRDNQPLGVVATAKTDTEETLVSGSGVFVLMKPTDGQTITITHPTFTCQATVPKAGPSTMDRTRLECVEAP